MGITVPIHIFYIIEKQWKYSLFNNFIQIRGMSSSREESVNKGEFENKEDMLVSYLAGLIEGGGYLHIPNPPRACKARGEKELKSSTGKSNISFIEVVFAEKDSPFAEKLKKKFGGNVYKHQNKKVIRWMIQDIKSVIYTINAVNGKFRTPKIIDLHRMIDFLNTKGENIKKLPLDSSPLNSNAWFAGLIDSDGCFSIKGFNSTNLRTYLGFQFYLPQRAVDKNGESLEEVMKKIAEFLSITIKTRVIYGKLTQFVVNTSSISSNKILINYLNTFPLLSSKYLDFKDWEKALSLYKKKLHRDPVYLDKIRILKLNMNTGRSSFNWSHLENYTPPQGRISKTLI